MVQEERETGDVKEEKVARVNPVENMSLWGDGI